MLIPMQSAPRERGGISRIVSESKGIGPLQSPSCVPVVRCRCGVLILTLRGVPGIGVINIFTDYPCDDDPEESYESSTARSSLT